MLGLEEAHIKSRTRRDRVILILRLSSFGGSWGNRNRELGFDKKLKVNTVKTSTHFLFRQALFYYKFFFRFSEDEQEMLIQKLKNFRQEEIFWSHSLDDLK